MGNRKVEIISFMILFEQSKRAYLKIKDTLFDLFFPIECLQCGAQKHWLCPGCLKGLQAELSVEKVYLDVDDYLDVTYVISKFSHKLMQRLIKVHKYNLVQDISRIFNEIISEKFDDYVIYHDADLVVPVPLHARRLRWRGFNQSALLARNFAEHYLLDYSEALIRSRHNQPQAQKTQLARLINIRDCFEVRGDVEGQAVWLIDDVVTTGATLNECAKALKAAGARRVFGLCLAHG